MTDSLQHLLETSSIVTDGEYGSWQEELQAILTGRKAMSKLETLTHSDADYREAVRIARELGLTLVHIPERSVPDLTSVYILTTDQMWRAQALQLLREKMLPSWSFEAEEMQSGLLGYSAQQTEEYVRQLRWTRIGFRGTTVILLMTSDQAVAVRRCRRCFSPVVLEAGITFACVRSLLRRDAASLVPDKVIGRVELRMDSLQEIFGREITDRRVSVVMSRRFDVSDFELVNSALTSNIEILENDEWE